MADEAAYFGDQVALLTNTSVSLEKRVRNTTPCLLRSEKLVNEQEAFQYVIDHALVSVPEYSLTAADLLADYCQEFPSLIDSALNRLADFCESDTNIDLRIRAIESMTKIGCSIPEQLPRVAYLLVQILPVNDVQDSRESEAVIKGLKSLLNTDPSGVLTAVFHQLKTGEPQNRSSVIAFLEEYFFKNKDQYLHSSKKAELVFVEQLLQALPKLSGDEAAAFLTVLPDMQMYKDRDDYQLLEFYADLADVGLPVLMHDRDVVDDILLAFRRHSKALERGAPKIVAFLREKIIEMYYDQLDEPQKVMLLRIIAELSGALRLADVKTLLPAVFNLLKAHLPKKPEAGDPAPLINISKLEYLLYAFHNFTARAPDVAAKVSGISERSDVDNEQLGPLLECLKYLVQNLNVYLDQLMEKRKTITNEEPDGTTNSQPPISETLRTDFAIAVCNNVLTMAEALVKSPPVLLGRSAEIVLAFKKFSEQPEKKSTPNFRRRDRLRRRDRRRDRDRR